MKEMPQLASCKAMTITSYVANTKRAGEEYYFIHCYTREKRLLKKAYKKAYEYRITRPLLQTLSGYIEASKCRTLDNFTEEVKQ